MRLLDSEQAYRSAAAHGATQIGLTLVVYDSLAADLSRSGEASAQRDVQMRCRYSCHALQLLGHLESWLTYLDEEALRSSLVTFYAFLRSEILRLQQAEDARDFRTLATLVGETRAAWQHKEKLGLINPVTTLRNTGIESEKLRSSDQSGFTWSA